MPNIKVISKGGKEAELTREAVAHINPSNCVNCGTCREACGFPFFMEDMQQCSYPNIKTPL
ncbi:4Fe-4S binding protein [Caproiciproducens sp.]